MMPRRQSAFSAKVLEKTQDRIHEAMRILRHPIFLATVAVALLAGILLGIVLRVSYDGELDNGRARATNLSRLLEEQTIRSFQAIDLVLQGMSDAVSSFTIPRHDPAFRQVLARRLQALPHVRALYVVGPDGSVTHTTEHPPPPGLNLSDREYFKVHQQDASIGLHIGKPLLSRGSPHWFVGVSRRVDDLDGGFGGIVAAAVEPAFYDGFLGELHLAPYDAINLLHADATLIARAPAGHAAVGQKFTSLALFSDYLPRSPSGSYMAISQVDGRPRIVSYRAVRGLPLVVTVALNREAILANWRSSAYAGIVGFVLLALLSLSVAFAAVRRLLERSMAQERALATQRLEMLGQMTGGITHDFNNLIGVANANLALAERHLDNPSRLRMHIAALHETLDRGAGLTARLLTFARRQSLEVTAEDANELLRALEPMLRQAAGAGISLTLRLAPGLPTCLVDRAQFDAALLNLVINARDAMSDGGAIEIATTLWTESATSPTLRPGSYVRAQVRDTGSGMLPAHLERAFEPLFSTKGEKGTGLGLPQVYGFMSRIGGDVRISSRLGAGTTVDLLFPCTLEGGP